jgi:hypothetical protein
VPYQGTNGLITNGLANPNLEWEETRKLNIGIDLGLMKDRLLLTGNFFRNRSSNQLLQFSLPYITGFTSIGANLPAVIENSGVEASLTSTNIKNSSFTWNTTFNLTIPRNKLVSFANLSGSPYSNLYIVGKPVTILRVYHFLGVDQVTGKYQVADAQGKPTFTPNATTDNTSLVNLSPRFYGGLDNSFSYKGVRLDILFQFVKQMGANYFAGYDPGSFYSGNQPTSVLKRWQKPGDHTNIQRYETNGSILAQYNNYTTSDAAYSDASFIRLKTVAVSWDLPQKWIERIHFKNCKLFIHGQNLLTITSYKGMDPENLSTALIPPLRVLTVGANFTL